MDPCSLKSESKTHTSSFSTQQMKPLLQASSVPSEQAVSVKFEPANENLKVEGTCYASSGAFCMRLSHEKARVTTKTRGVISPLGEIIAHDVSFDPIVNCCLKS